MLFRGSSWLKSELQKSFSFPYQLQADEPDGAEEVWTEGSGPVRVVASPLGVCIFTFHIIHTPSKSTVVGILLDGEEETAAWSMKTPALQKWQNIVLIIRETFL